MRLQWFAVAVVLTTAAALTACGDERGAGQTWRTVSAPGLAFDRVPVAEDRELHVRFTVNALTATPDPVDHVEVSRQTDRIGIRVWLRERVPADDEHVPNYSGTQTTVITLEEPVGQATVVDLSADPPTPVPTR
jgi:hypothetical protein